MPSGDSAALAKIIRENVLVNRASFEAMGADGRKYYEENYTLDMCIDNLVKIIKNGKLER